MGQAGLIGVGKGIVRLVTHPWAAAVLLLPVAVSFAFLVAAPMDYQSVNASTDDTFYYYSWAWNLAHGHGATADGVTLTNGVQPLWAWLLTGLAFVSGDKPGFMSGALALCLVFDLLAAAIWFRIAHRLGGPVLAWCTGLVTSMVLLRIQWVVLTGMEISLNLLLVSLAVLACLHLSDHGWRRERCDPLLLGLLFALLLLGRNDHLLHFAPLVLLELGLRLARRPGIFPFMRRRDLPWLLAPVVALLVPYYLVNKAQFGYFLPVSGRIKIWNAAREFQAAGLDSVWDRLPVALSGGWYFGFKPLQWIFKSVGAGPAWQALGAAGPAVLAVVALAVTEATRRRHVLIAIGLGALVILPRTMVHSLQLREVDLQYASWYRSVALLGGLLLVGWILSRLLFLIPWRRGLAAAITLLVLATLVMGLGKVVSVPRRGVDAMRLPMAKVAAVRWAEANLPADAVVGSFNSGIMHWYAERPVLNLDGRVDDGSLYRLRLEGGGYRDFMRRRGVTCLIDTWVDSSFWDALADEGAILHRVPYRQGRDKELVVLQFQPVPGER